MRVSTNQVVGIVEITQEHNPDLRDRIAGIGLASPSHMGRFASATGMPADQALLWTELDLRSVLETATGLQPPGGYQDLPAGERAIFSWVNVGGAATVDKAHGEAVEMPKDGYMGDYIREIAREYVSAHFGDAAGKNLEQIRRFAVEYVAGQDRHPYSVRLGIARDGGGRVLVDLARVDVCRTRHRRGDRD